jgi:hypothetical protein
MGEWFRAALIELIDTYKKNENLYNPKHSLYYNKQARKKSLEAILDAVRASRPNTSILEIHKKIQSLRTQFGQEVSKIEKSKGLGDEKLIYTPKVSGFDINNAIKPSIIHQYPSSDLVVYSL